MSDIKNIQNDYSAKLNNNLSLEEINQIKTELFGKNGLISSQFKNIGSIPETDRKKFASDLNQIKDELQNLITSKIDEIESKKINEKLEKEKIDVTLPSRPKMKGSLHPVMNTIDEISTIFHGIGFDVADGPEIEDDFHNFTALNIPESHPARAMHDTFYVNKEYVLRTHTSPVQIRYMENNTPPIQIISPGRVYRVDSDATHSPMFHQVEGLVINEDVNFANLKGVVQSFLQSFFEDENLTIRFRPSYFPFTEPSAEIDMSWNDGWLEIGGCGMVHPNVLKHVNIHSEMYQGFAFGLGVERLTMLKYGINDLRHFFNHDLRFLEQFK